MARGHASKESTCYLCNELITIGSMQAWAPRASHLGYAHESCYDSRRASQPQPIRENGHTTPKPSPDAGPADMLAQTLAKYIEPFLDVQRDEITEELEARLTELIDDRLKNQPKTTVYIQQGKTIGQVEGLKHEQFDLLYDRIKNMKNVYLYGEAGSGKSTSAQIIATSLGRKFYFAALTPDTQKHELLGYMFGTEYIRTSFRDAYEFGGVFLLDECDNGRGSTLMVMNGALANKKCAFPDRIVNMHPEFVCIAAGNTAMLGATASYSDRRKTDQAFRNRFRFIEWNTDKALEIALAKQAFEHGETWATWVQNVREYAKKTLPDLVVTQRDTMDGAVDLARGIKLDEVLDELVWRGIDQTAINAVLSRFPKPTFAGVN